MRYSDIRDSVLAQWAAPRGQAIVPCLMSEPGLGKSACARDIARAFLASHGLPYVDYDSAANNFEEATVVEFTASLREPVDVMGIPMTEASDFTRWKPPAEFYALRHGTGIKILIEEELPDGTVPMQNALCRVNLDKHAGNLRLTDQLYIIATGNRTQDKSGANRLTSKLAGRMRLLELTANLDDFAEWWLQENLDPVVLQYLRWKGEHLVSFDPNRFANANPRSWERVALVPHTLRQDVYREHVAGEVSEGIATEFVGFRQIWSELPDLDEVIRHPETAKVPTNLATVYALSGALARKATKDNFANVMTFLDRLPRENNVMAIKDAIKLKPELKRTPAFVTWAINNQEVVL